MAKKIAKSPIVARDRLGANTTDNNTDSTDRDPWPHTGDLSSLDAFHSLGVGFVLYPLRELLAARLFTPLLRTHELHATKEGFTFGIGGGRSARWR